MELHNKNCQVICSVEQCPELGKFDIVHNLDHVDTKDIYMARTFQINHVTGQFIHVALLDYICSDGKSFCILEQTHLIVILFHRIVKIDLETGQIIHSVECENTGGLQEILQLSNGYLIRSECDIFRYDDAWNRIWHFSGRDILVSPYSNDHFWIKDAQIHCRDFLGWHYVLDLDGILMREYREFPTDNI